MQTIRDTSPQSDTQSPGPAAWRDRWERRLLVIAVIIVCAGVLAKASMSLKPYLDAPVRRLHKDIDWGLLNGGLAQIHDFQDTGRWWTSTWCGQVPFWRPLTSYALWAEWLLWPKEYLLPRQVVLVVMHLCFTALAALLLWKLTRRPWLVLIAIYLFAGLRPYHMGGPQAYILPVNDLLQDPKNIPDPLVALAMVGSLILLVDRRWLGALVLAVVSVGFKENGFTVWPLAVLVLGWVHREKVFARDGLRYVQDSIQRNRIPIAMWTAAFCLLLFVHYMTVGMGYRQGTNSFWSWRVLAFIGGPVLPNLLQGDQTAGFMSCVIFIAVLASWRWRLIWRFLAMLGAVALGIGIDALIQHVAWGVSAARIISMGQSVDSTAMCLLWLAVMWIARTDWRYIAFGVLLALVAGAPSWMAAQAWAHTRYVASVFMEMAVAAVIIQNIKTIGGYLAGLRRADGSAHAG